MRNIAKGGEPASLTQHRATAFADYDNYQDEDPLRAKGALRISSRVTFLIPSKRPIHDGWPCLRSSSSQCMTAR
jgi:hypothetical protein